MADPGDNTRFETAIHSVDRLAALAETKLLDAPTDEAFDRLTRIATRALGVRVALVSLVADDRQFFLSQCGLPGDVADRRETPLSRSFCKLVVVDGEPLIVADARTDGRVKGHPAIADLSVIAYAGFPIVSHSGEVLGSFCAIDGQPKDWGEGELEILRDLSKAASAAIELQVVAMAEAEARAEAELQRRRIRSVLNSTGEGMYGLDEQGRCTFANPKCAELLGYDSPEDFVGQHMHSLIHHTRPDGSPYPVEQCQIYQALSRHTDVVCSSEVYWKKDGTSIPVEYRSFPVEGGGESAAVVTFSDITERLDRRKLLVGALEAAESANREKSRFLANMSHEIRTPMNSILGFSDLLESHVEGAKPKRYLEAITSSGESLLALINDILDLSKIEAGRLELNPAPVGPRQMLDGISLMFSQQADEQNLDFSATVGEGCPDYLLLDELRVRQLLLNLLGNAFKFTARGEVRARFDVRRDPLDDRYLTVVLTVADTGAGIPEEKLRTIFKPFQQAAPDTAAKGTGLGLSICQQIASLMGGEMGVVSEVGKGSTFTVRIPNVEVALPPEDEEPLSSGECDLNLLKASRVLVVDDNPFNRELAAGYLDGSHHEVEFAENGREAVEKVRDWSPDVVLMDIRMPVMDGKEARRRIKEDPELKRIPVVAVTASSLVQQTSQLRREFDGYVRKPFSRTELFDALGAVLPRFEESVIEELAEATDVATERVNASAWVPLVAELRQLESGRVPELVGAMAIGEISAFARQLLEFAERDRCAPLADYAEALAEQASLFELSKIEASLASFSELVDTVDRSASAATRGA